MFSLLFLSAISNQSISALKLLLRFLFALVGPHDKPADGCKFSVLNEASIPPPSVKTYILNLRQFVYWFVLQLLIFVSPRISIIYFVIPQKDIPLVYALSLREREFEYKNMQIIENMAIKTAIYFHLLPFFERTCASDVKQIQFIKKQSLTVK